MRLSNAIEEFEMARNDLSRKTLETYSFYLKLWLRRQGDQEAEDVTPQDLDRFMTGMRDGYQSKYDRPLWLAQLLDSSSEFLDVGKRKPDRDRERVQQAQSTPGPGALGAPLREGRSASACRSLLQDAAGEDKQAPRF